MEQIYLIAALALLALGAAITAVSGPPLRDIGLETRAHSRAAAVLPALIFVFSVAYAVCAVLLARRGDTLGELVLAAVLCVASCCVWLVARTSLVAIRETQRIGALQRHRAAYDALTSLPNRLFFVQQLDKAIGGQKVQRRMAVLVLDLDRFKLINDTLGHQYGDVLLHEVGLRLHGSLRASDLLARLGGDEFGILIDPVDHPEHLDTIAGHVASVLEAPFALEGHPADVGVSIGAAFYPEHGHTSNTLMKNAEIAMYEAKRRGAELMIYDRGFDTHDLGRLDIVSGLKTAIDEAALLVQYQPQIGAKSGKLTGVEALVRWPHPRLGLLLPEEFIALAERSGLINRLNRWVLDIVFEQLAAWRAQGIDTPISTNISVINLQDPDLFQHIVEGLRERGLAASQLRLEITETAVMSDPQVALAAVRRLAELGVRLSIDDFGTGYSSLLYLREMPVDEIKIDRSFIANVTRDNNDAIIVRSTIDLAHNMGRAVTAEGVESPEAFKLLRRWNCDTLQGFYLSPPLSIDDLNLRLKDPRWSLPAAPLPAN